MNKYIAIFTKSDKAIENSLMVLHVEHLAKMYEESNLLLCGPFKNSNKVIQIILANSKEEAETLLKRDPFYKESIFKDYTLNELIEANEENNYLLK